MSQAIGDILEDLSVTYRDSWCGKAERGLEAKFGRPTNITKAATITKLEIPIDVVDKQWKRKDGTTIDFVQPGLQTDECTLVSGNRKVEDAEAR